MLFYLSSQVSYSLQRLTAFQSQNLYIGPQSESELSHKALDLNPLFPGAKVKPDPIKGGLRVTSFFNYNCLAVSLSETMAMQKIFSHTYSNKKQFNSPDRDSDVVFTMFDLKDSKDLYSECLRTFWSCPNCDLYMPLTPLERMQHEASCRPAGEGQQLEEGQEFLLAVLGRLLLTHSGAH